MAQSNFTISLKLNEALALASEAEIEFPLPQPWPKEISADAGWLSGVLGISIEINEATIDHEQCPIARDFFYSLLSSIKLEDSRYFKRLDGRDVGYQQLIRAVRRFNADRRVDVNP